MSSTVFIVDPDNKLTQLRRTPYDSEDLFQTLLADHPAVLGLASGGSGALLLVNREHGVPEAEGGAGRWSIDHLFIDREGVPVLVEIKRATDTRIRREVVAQMLDYAANGVAYWSIDQMISAVEVAAPTGVDGDVGRLEAFLDGADSETFWRRVEANLSSGRIRMVFVADRIPHELRRIVEFLNGQMRPAEVLAIEVEQFATHDGLRLLTPRLVGATERARTVKAVQGAKPAIDVEDWLSNLTAVKGDDIARLARKAADWFAQHGCGLEPNAGQDALIVSRIDAKDHCRRLFGIRDTGRLEVALASMKNSPAFVDPDLRTTILKRLAALPVKTKPADNSNGWPSIVLLELIDPSAWQGFTSIAGDIITWSDEGGRSAPGLEA